MERRAGTRQGWSPACFNPRSRVGSDDRIFGNEVADHVSIHAPAWGATHNYSNNLSSLSVSIHAPAWGATGPCSSVVRQTSGFNPRSRVGSDVIVQVLAMLVMLFQSTLPRGERQDIDNRCVLVTSFNPRSRVGSDGRTERLPCAGNIVSIHAPAWGATEHRGCAQDACSVSIHAPAWGATKLNLRLLVKIWSFNPRSRVGSDISVTYFFFVFRCFNPRSRVGSDTRRCFISRCL